MPCPDCAADPRVDKAAGLFRLAEVDGTWYVCLRDPQRSMPGWIEASRARVAAQLRADPDAQLRIEVPTMGPDGNLYRVMLPGELQRVECGRDHDGHRGRHVIDRDALLAARARLAAQSSAS